MPHESYNTFLSLDFLQKAHFPPLLSPFRPPWLFQEMRLVMRSNMLRDQLVCCSTVLVWGSGCQSSCSVLLMANRSGEMRRGAFRAWLSSSGTFYLGAPQSNASCCIYIKSEYSSNPSWFGLEASCVEVKTPESVKVSLEICFRRSLINVGNHDGSLSRAMVLLNLFILNF